MTKERNLGEDRGNILEHLKGMKLRKTQIERIYGMVKRGDEEFMRRLKDLTKWHSKEWKLIYSFIDKLVGSGLIDNSQQTIRGNNTNTSPSVPQKVKELSEVGCDRKLPSSADTSNCRAKTKEDRG